MDWSTMTPTQEGLYWFWDSDLKCTVWMVLEDRGDGLWLDEPWGNFRRADEMPGQWYGPLQPPEPPKEAK